MRYVTLRPLGLGGNGCVRLGTLGSLLGELFRQTFDAGEIFFGGDGCSHCDRRVRPRLVSALYHFAQGV